MVPGDGKFETGSETGPARSTVLPDVLRDAGSLEGNSKVIDWEKVADKVIKAALIAWAMWLSSKFNANLQHFTGALSTFNANFGPALPPMNRTPKGMTGLPLPGPKIEAKNLEGENHE